MGSILETSSHTRRAEFLEAAARSHKLHHPWATPPRDTISFDKYIERFKSPAHAGYWVVTETGELAGVIAISEIVRGSFQSGYLGYYAFVPHAAKGYMKAGLAAVLTDAFRNLKLHRLEANIQPENERSRQLVQRLGFRLEGFSPQYLKIGGRWRDHERWALTVENWRRSSPSRRG